MAEESEKTPIQSVFAQQFAEALAGNRTEQEAVTAQIAGLQKRLEQLQVDEAWLTQAQDTLPAALAPSETEPAAAVAEAPPSAPAEQVEPSAPGEAVAGAPQTTVPQPRQDRSAQAEPPKEPAKKAAAAKKKTTAKKTTAKKTTAKKTTAEKTTAKKAAAKKTAAKKAVAEQAPAPEAAIAEAPAEKAAAEAKPGPPLWELIQGILLKTPGQPCVAREVTDQLAKDHPTRATSIQTVRNNLETLVKKNLAEKSHQQGSAMYTAYADEGAPSADEPAGGEGEQAPETADEKVPAEV
ncbi:hypothetical protein [Streptomyces sp. NPDC005538]|uniref:hypothetical protein n=1 Tax=Streptomyces sp. NPDC005538 TaxID=3157043 RepID=UPI0033B68AA0